MEQLKSCPFCGEIPEVTTTAIIKANPSNRYYVQCNNYYCRIRPMTDVKDNEEEAIDDWNRRD